MDVREYLERIRFHEIPQVNYASLAELQQKHLVSVPFENLDVIHKRPIVLDVEALFDKIVRQKRGGFCYELNGLFAWLLGELGFHVARLSAQVYDGDRGDFGPEFDHMTLLVDLGGQYLVDVGFGDSLRTPLPMPRGRVEDISGSYRVYSNPYRQMGYELQRQNLHGWQPQYRFTTLPRQLAEFEPMCTYHQSSPKSSFTQRVVCTRATVNGRLTLTANSLTTTEGHTKKIHHLTSSTEFDEILGEYFGIK